MTWQQVYWITRLDSVSIALGIVMFIAFFGAAFTGIGMVVNEGDDSLIRTLKKWTLRFSLIGFVLLLVNIFVPSTKEAAAIYIIPKVANNEQVHNIGDKGLKLLEAKFDEWLKDTAGEEAGEK